MLKKKKSDKFTEKLKCNYTHMIVSIDVLLNNKLIKEGLFKYKGIVYVYNFMLSLKLKLP